MLLYQNPKLYQKKCLYLYRSPVSVVLKTKRKENLSPPGRNIGFSGIKAFFFAPLTGTLTVEAAVVLPLFLFCMIAALQFCAVMETSIRLGSALCESGKEIASAAYATAYTGGTEGNTGAAAGAVSFIYAQASVMKKAGDTSAVKNANVLLSSFMEDGEMVDLVLTYQIKTPFSVVRLPGYLFIQKASVRAWTGRSSDSAAGDEGDSEEEQVYVTETGSVYHTNADCTHLRLSVRAAEAEELEHLRNRHGAIYHACEKCGKQAGSTVYITTEGTRYHSSLSCSGLKRTVRQVPVSELGGMKLCSKCEKE